MDSQLQWLAAIDNVGTSLCRSLAIEKLNISEARYTSGTMKSIDWTEYERVHADRQNLLVHLVAVPLFAVAFIVAILNLLQLDLLGGTIALMLCVVAMILQRRGHAVEPNPPRPLTGPRNFLRRWFTEQYVIFPTFLLSGRWWRQYREAAR